MKKIEKVLTICFTVLFLSVAIFGVFYGIGDQKYKGVTLSAVFGIMMWFKWTELELNLE